jgi:hypothetical protein
MIINTHDRSRPDWFPRVRTRQISGKEPERYLTERRDSTDLGEAEVRTRLESHFSTPR